MKKEDTAFPCSSSLTGLSKGEYIAAAILAGMGSWVPVTDLLSPRRDHPEEVLEHKANWAVAQADALLKALKELSV